MKQVIGLAVMVLGVAGVAWGVGAPASAENRTPEAVVRAYTEAARREMIGHMEQTRRDLEEAAGDNGSKSAGGRCPPYEGSKP